MCNFWVNFVLDNDASPGKLRFAALQSEVGRALLERSGRKPDDISSIVLVESSRAHIKSDAVLRIGEILGIPSLARSVIPQVFADSIYDIVSSLFDSPILIFHAPRRLQIIATKSSGRAPPVASPTTALPKDSSPLCRRSSRVLHKFFR